MAKKRKPRGKRQPEVAAVACEVLLGQVAQARSHVEGAIDGSDPEELHDLRVAVRRMRAALRLFGRALPAAGSALDPARASLKETGAILGRARDLDVQIARLEGWMQSAGRAHDPEAARAAAMLSNDRRIARVALRRHLRGAVFAGRLSAVEGAARAALSAPARRTAPRLLRRPSKQVLLAVARARANASDPTVFHALRIDIKRLRYALEFLAPCLPFSPRSAVGRLREAQDTLGALQDAAVEQGLADRLITRAANDEAVRNLLEHYKHSQADVQAGLLAACAEMLGDLEASVRALRAQL